MFSHLVFFYYLCPLHILFVQSFKDEDIYTFFEPELPYDREYNGNGKSVDGKSVIEKHIVHGHMKTSVHSNGNMAKTLVSKEKSVKESELRRQEGSSVLDLKGENYFSCAVGCKRSNARYLLPSSEDVICFLNSIAASYSNHTLSH